MIKSLYIIGSLRNRDGVLAVSQAIKEETMFGTECFDDWLSPGPHADDEWRDYEKARGSSYKEALRNYAGQHVYEFDKYHLDRCDGAVLVLPCGKSGHIEMGYVVGRGKPVFVLMDDPDRWDIMYQFAFENGGNVCFNLEELVYAIQSYRGNETDRAFQ